MAGRASRSSIGRAVAAALLFSACGGAGHSATLVRIDSAMRGLHSYGFVTTTTLSLGDGGKLRDTMTITGVADTSRGLMRMVETDADSGGHSQYVISFSEHKSFDNFDAADVRPMTPRGWCVFPITTSRGLGVSFADTIAKLARSNRHAMKLGTAVVRGTATTHYRVSGGGLATIEIWVDSNDQLRRIRVPVRQGVESTDLFDFNTPVTIAVPKHAPPCIKPTTPTLGRSNTNLPSP